MERPLCRGWFVAIMDVETRGGKMNRFPPKKIMVPFDFSGLSAAALPTACCAAL
jgi:hypothetical protein